MSTDILYLQDVMVREMSQLRGRRIYIIIVGSNGHPIITMEKELEDVGKG